MEVPSNLHRVSPAPVPASLSFLRIAPHVIKRLIARDGLLIKSAEIFISSAGRAIDFHEKLILRDPKVDPVA
jgi:hypothetical protein